jgi:hypothetical protein
MQGHLPETCNYTQCFFDLLICCPVPPMVEVCNYTQCCADLLKCCLSRLRYLDFMEGHLAETCNYTLQPELRDELATAIQHLEVRRRCTFLLCYVMMLCYVLWLSGLTVV